jgi:hypothetical protein
MIDVERMVSTASLSTRREQPRHPVTCGIPLPAPIESNSNCLAINELGHDDVNVLGPPDIVNHQNVRMVQGRGRSRFMLELAYAFLVGDEIRRQHFHGERKASLMTPHRP